MNVDTAEVEGLTFTGTPLSMTNPGGQQAQTEERRRTPDRRQSRRHEQRQLRSIVEQLADGIVIVGADGLIRFVNPAAEHLFGRSARELLGTAFGFAVTNGGSAQIDVLRPGGESVAAELRVVDLSWEGEAARLVSIRDVTERRRAEERVRQLERERAARLEAEAASHAKSELLATMSHELRTPLNAVLGYSELLNLEVGGALSPEQRHQVDRIRASGRHLLDLVDQVLDLARSGAGRLTVDIAAYPAGATADAAAALIQPYAESEGITFTDRSPPGESVFYEGDEDRVRQILVNLLTNAVKFTEAGGTVVLEYGCAGQPDAETRLSGSGPWTYFRVTDSGIGIAADQLSRIFYPFVQVESGLTRPSDGSGLGLTISRRLARLMRGDLTVRSTVGRGSVFTLWLPCPSVAGSVAVDERASSMERVAEPGLAEIGEILMRELETLLDTFVRRLRLECPAPGADGLRFSQLADHVASYLADLAGILIAVDESGGRPTSVLADAGDLHRLMAGRHGAQRARLGWDETAVRCEYDILRGEIERVVRERSGSIEPSAVEEALAMIARFLEQAEQSSLRGFARARTTGEPD